MCQFDIFFRYDIKNVLKEKGNKIMKNKKILIYIIILVVLLIILCYEINDIKKQYDINQESANIIIKGENEKNELESRYASLARKYKNDTNTLKELSTEGTLSFDQYQKAKTSVNNMITQLYGNTKAGRILLNQYDPNNPANENLLDGVSSKNCS